ncbi:MAG: Alkaline phosphatase like protein [Candidatus Carbobacillus altaicus]|uniref:Alkaline phosphatase like protein n=1 Tax=Candidatus Carbonibacillus altaicus TaxID=2163959 RepID=A0A2R6Y3E5_9BACL|nr:MAG: Alkaline phosphatase like protein [Candidatus Carbobacillus altaicus]
MHDIALTIFQGLSNLGAWGIALALMIEIIPSEIVLAYGGYLIASGVVGFIPAFLAALFGGVMSQLFLYWLGRYGGRPAVLKYGKYIFIRPHHLDVAERWFVRYGPGVIFSARFVPVVRHAISIPAGLARMPHSTFILYTALAIIPWSLLFFFLGFTIRENWADVQKYASVYMPYLLIVAVVALGIYLWVVKKRDAGNR